VIIKVEFNGGQPSHPFLLSNLNQKSPVEAPESCHCWHNICCIIKSRNTAIMITDIAFSKDVTFKGQNIPEKGH
jgi:hypothetical protein